MLILVDGSLCVSCHIRLHDAITFLKNVLCHKEANISVQNSGIIIIL